MSSKTMLKAFVLCTMLFLTHVSYSQNKVVSGKVTDSKDGSPLPGVTVNAKNSTVATQTATDGSFSIHVPAASRSLVFSFVGFVSQEVSVQGKSTVNVSLVLTSTSLGEVVVVGYGTQRKRDVTASISKISADKIANVPAPSFESALAGKAAGVQVLLLMDWLVVLPLSVSGVSIL